MWFYIYLFEHVCKYEEQKCNTCTSDLRYNIPNTLLFLLYVLLIIQLSNLFSYHEIRNFYVSQVLVRTHRHTYKLILVKE